MTVSSRWNDGKSRPVRLMPSGYFEGMPNICSSGKWLATLAALVLGLSALNTHADEYPNHPITLIVPSPAGGGTDTQARTPAPKLGEILGRPIVIENRSGASGNIGAQAVAKAEPDGYTLLAMISSHVINPFVLKPVPYDIDHDFAMISRTVTVPEVLVGTPSLSAKDLKVARFYESQSRQSRLRVGRRRQGADVKLLHVPYRGSRRG
jgi:tripartite-type tricarboxylate transporter receptor subunit TctC